MRIAAGLGGLLLVAQIVLLSVQLHVLSSSYHHIRAQDAKQTRLYPLQRDTARNALPVLDQAKRAIGPLGRSTRKLVQATQMLPDLALQLQQTIQDVHALRGMTATSVDLQQRSVAVQQQSLAIQQQSLAVQQQSLAVQRQSADLQRQAVAVLRESRGIQQETLQHTRNLDNKTGGSLTAR